MVLEVERRASWISRSRRAIERGPVFSMKGLHVEHKDGIRVVQWLRVG